MLNTDELQILRKAIDIAHAYLVGTGYEDDEARTRATQQVGAFFKEGERRPLMLANRAIEQIELQDRLANQFGVITETLSWPA